MEFSDPNTRNLVAEVTVKSTKVYCEGAATRILAFDCGMKHNIIRFFAGACKVQLSVVPYDYDLQANPEKIEYDGVFISNGPGDPVMCSPTIAR